jgi:hypothetical protein
MEMFAPLLKDLHWSYEFSILRLIEIHDSFLF